MWVVCILTETTDWSRFSRRSNEATSRKNARYIAQILQASRWHCVLYKFAYLDIAHQL